MKYAVVYFLLITFAPPHRFGSTSSELVCKSESGRTLFKAKFEDFDVLENAELKVDKDKMLFSATDRCHVFFDPENGVYTLHIESEAYSNFDTLRYVELWAIPASFKALQPPGSRYNDSYEFKGKMKARDPRKNKEYETPVITLDCKLVHTGP